MPPVQYQFKNLNHLGLVAAMCRELNVALVAFYFNCSRGNAVLHKRFFTKLCGLSSSCRHHQAQYNLSFFLSVL